MLPINHLLKLFVSAPLFFFVCIFCSAVFFGWLLFLERIFYEPTPLSPPSQFLFAYWASQTHVQFGSSVVLITRCIPKIYRRHKEVDLPFYAPKTLPKKYPFIGRSPKRINAAETLITDILPSPSQFELHI